MLHPDARSLNLSNCAALVLFEALRQQGFGKGERSYMSYMGYRSYKQSSVRR